MPHCDYCGTFYRGGSLKHGRYRFCNGVCFERGKVLSILDNYPQTQIDNYIHSLQMEKCQECGAPAKNDFHKSHSIYSIMVYSSWKTQTHFCCQKCGRKHQAKAALFSFLFGWWGIPWGLFLTPVQIGKNIIGILRTGSRASKDLVRYAKLDLANKLVQAKP